ncbi:MAG: redoxin domain-containing protein [Planctomycetes bacterium]|nr:redoxin domain-containing protein [Planctomycetota bacterium]
MAVAPSRNARVFKAAALAALLFCGCARSWELADDLKKEDRDAAPDFPEGLSWINTEGGKPLKMADLKGKVVLLDFWNFGCINCMHVIPDLKRLEKKYEKELVVIGVHSAKFSNEKGLANIRNAALRYGLEHPVLNDNDLTAWKRYGVKAWPTLLLIDPTGKIVGKVEGEGHYETLEAYVDGIVKFYDPQKLIDRTKVIGKPEQLEKSALRYPGKVCAQAKPERIFISDTNHNRLLVCGADGKVSDVIGAGSIGRADGAYDAAQFHRPEGLAVLGDALYVADTENHLIRKVDLAKKTVETLAGNGEVKFNAKKGPAKQTPLNSPWDVAIAPDGNTLYIAMAGNHAIWSVDLKDGTVGRLAGTGREDIRDGEFGTSNFAQPSGLWLDGDNLYVADAESSGVRLLDLKEQMVTTLVGTGLFEFGDKDGVGDDVLIQHCLSILLHNGKLFLTDTYNHKLKQLDPKTRECKTYLGDGQPGKVDGGAPRFYEPGGQAILGEKLYVADTNNHAIRVVDLKTKQVSTLEIKLPEK